MVLLKKKENSGIIHNGETQGSEKRQPSVSWSVFEGNGGIRWDRGGLEWCRGG